MAISQNDPIKAIEVAAALDKKVNTSGALTFTDIISGGDLSGKVASADAVRSLNINLQSVFLRGGSRWIQSNETHRYRMNTPGSFIFTAYGTSADQWSLYYINNQPPGHIHKVLGTGTQPSIAFNNNTELVIHNNVGWAASYYLLGEFTMLS